jgi:branched-chain amino acid transport system permease protein
MSKSVRAGVIALGVAVAFLVMLWVVDRPLIGQMTLGLGTGALIAALAIGVVLTYKGSGVVNFHNGAVAIFVAYIFHGLRGRFDGPTSAPDGKLYLPPLPNPLALVEGLWNSFVTKKEDWIDLPNIPTKVDLDFTDGRMPFVTAFIVALVYAAVLGLIFHFLIFKPLRAAPPLAKVVASIGIFLVTIQVITIRFTGTVQPVVEPKLPDGVIKMASNDIVINQRQLVLAGLVLLAAAALVALFRFTRFGLATRAAAENEKGAVVLGFSPDFLAGSNWVLSTVLAGAFGILVSPSVNLDNVVMPFLIIPTLGAALLGSFNSIFVTALAGLGIGMMREMIPPLGTKAWYVNHVADWLPASGVRLSLPFLVIVLVLFLRGKNLPTRGSVFSGRLPAAPMPTLVRYVTCGAIAAVWFVAWQLGFEWRQAAVFTLIGVAMALSMVVITGYVGQISLANAALGGVAGFALSKWFQDIGWLPFPLAPIAAALVAALFGVAVAVPALRVRGVNLAIVTMAAALTIEELVFKNPKLAGTAGTLAIDPPSIGGKAFGPGNSKLRIAGIKAVDDVPPQMWFVLLALAVVVLLALLVVNIRRSATGRRFLAVRSNERAAAAAGVSVSATKLTAFALSSFIAGIGGALLGYNLRSVSPGNFGVLPSLTLLAFAYLGGISSVSGAVASGFITGGGLVIILAEKYTGIDDEFRVLVAGVGLILNAILNPEGISGAVRAGLRGGHKKPSLAPSGGGH